MENTTLHPRLLVPRLQEALQDTPVVLVTGPGKPAKPRWFAIWQKPGFEQFD